MTEPTDAGASTADQLFSLIRSFGYTTHGQTAEIVDAIVAKWGTPPAVAVPLTSAQIEAAAPEYSVDDFLDFNAGVRFAEQHHGVKGEKP